MKKVIIAGKRDFTDYRFVEEKINNFRLNILDDEPFEVVCGKATGIDSLGERYGIENNLPIKYFPADWEKYNKFAGPKRNKKMAEYGDILLLFYDGKSKGSKSMLYEAKLKNLEIHIVNI